jgi:hypothetical protein
MKKFMIGVLSTIGVLMLMTGCMGTRTAYKAAQSPSDYAWVISKHYEALQTEAIRLKDAGTLNGANLENVRAIDASAAPLVTKLGPLAQTFTDAKEAYQAGKSAQTQAAFEKAQADLQAAIDAAVVRVAELSRIITSFGGKTGALPLHGPPLAYTEVIGLVPIYD